MTSVLLHHPPRRGAVVMEQVLAVGTRLRQGAVLLGGVVLALGAAVVYLAVDVRRFNAAHATHPMGLNLAFTPQMSGVVAVIAAFLPFLIWQDEDPSRRVYHWAMPVSRHLHSGSKVFAGWLWLMAVTLAFVLGIYAAAAAVARITGLPQLHPSDFAQWEWLVPFGATTTAYMIASALAVGTRRPLIWAVSVLATYGFILFALRTLDLHVAARRVQDVLIGRIGLLSILAGHVEVFDAATKEFHPHLGTWLTGLILWTGAGGLLLSISATRHAEPT